MLVVACACLLSTCSIAHPITGLWPAEDRDVPPYWILFAALVCPGPASISGLQLWLEADRLGLGDGDSVSSWADASSNAFTATQPSAGQQPVFRASAIGGLPGVEFTNNGPPGTHLTLGSDYVYSDGDGLTIIAVARSDATVSNPGHIIDFGLMADGGYGLRYGSNPDGSLDNYQFYTSADSGGAYQFVRFQSTTDAPNVLTAVVRFAGAGNPFQGVYANGALLESTTAITLAQLTEAEICESPTRGVGSGTGTPTADCTMAVRAGPVTIGGQSKTELESGRFFDGQLALMLIYNRALSAGERYTAECYAGRKYGITPFALSAP